MFTVRKAVSELARLYYHSPEVDHDELYRLAKAIRTNCTPAVEPPEAAILLGARHGWKHYGDAASA